MKNNILHRILSVILTTIVLLPFTIQTVHALHNHEYTICNAQDVQHIDQHTIDCGTFHQIIQQYSIDFSSEFELEINLFINFNLSHFYQNQYALVPQQFASRAPPYFIV